jgi:hypothetical protein
MPSSSKSLCELNGGKDENSSKVWDADRAQKTMPENLPAEKVWLGRFVWPIIYMHLAQPQIGFARWGDPIQ